MATYGGEDVPGVPRSTDVLQAIAWIVAVGASISACVNPYQRDWSQIAGPAVTTIATVCLTLSRELVRRASSPGADRL
jgi:hypothetical protein